MLAKCSVLCPLQCQSWVFGLTQKAHKTYYLDLEVVDHHYCWASTQSSPRKMARWLTWRPSAPPSARELSRTCSRGMKLVGDAECCTVKGRLGCYSDDDGDLDLPSCGEVKEGLCWCPHRQYLMGTCFRIPSCSDCDPMVEGCCLGMCCRHTNVLLRDYLETQVGESLANWCLAMILGVERFEPSIEKVHHHQHHHFSFGDWSWARCSCCLRLAWTWKAGSVGGLEGGAQCPWSGRRSLGSRRWLHWLSPSPRPTRRRTLYELRSCLACEMTLFDRWNQSNFARYMRTGNKATISGKLNKKKCMKHKIDRIPWL